MPILALHLSDNQAPFPYLKLNLCHRKNQAYITSLNLEYYFALC